MAKRRRCTRDLLLTACVLAQATLHPKGAHAQPAPSEPAPSPAQPAPQQPVQTPPPAAGLTPPRLVGAGCRTTLAPSGRVLLVLTIDERGLVTDVGVVESLSPEVDAEVVADARAFTFEPARRDGVPMAARIRFACEQMGLPHEVSPETPAPEPPAPSPSPEAVEAAPAATAPIAPQPEDRVTTPEQPEDDEAMLGARATAQTEAERLAGSAEAVDVVSLETAHRESADLGEVLARERGVSIRRSGGLGSDARIALAGLTDEQIRFFIDGVPIEYMGFNNGFANIPIDLADHAEIYRGVLPIRFGGDALGGAFNLAPREYVRGTAANASFEIGSFGTYRLLGGVVHRAPQSGFYTRAMGFGDFAENDYRVNVEVADESGRLSPATVRRFHDGYRAGGGVVELGFVDTPFADRLVLRVFATTFDKELQNNLVMSVPYGEAEYGGSSYGASLRYDQALRENVHLRAIGGYAYGRTDFLDVSRWVYNWYGERIRERTQPGELDTEPYDQSTYTHSGFARANLEWAIRSAHVLRFNVSPTINARTGEDRTTLPGGRDPLASERLLFTLTTGVEYDVTLGTDALHAIVFFKDYLYIARSDEVLPGGVVANRDRDSHSVGGGGALRYRLSEGVSVEATYERSTRLPSTHEVFGNGVLIQANLELEPELSHNVNVEGSFRHQSERAGTVSSSVRFLARVPENLIVLLGNDRFYSYRNVYASKTFGAELMANWVSRGDYVTLGANVSYIDNRNDSDDGPFAAYQGDRIPNRPWLFANFSARLDLDDLFTDGDELSLGYYLRYVHWFFRGWESVGTRDSKQRIPIQVPQAVALTYTVPLEPMTLVSTFEVQNLFDAEVYDNFGVQRPGRAFFLKVALSYGGVESR